MGEDIKIEQSSGNVFSDLGLRDEEAKEELLTAQRGGSIRESHRFPAAQ